MALLFLQLINALKGGKSMLEAQTERIRETSPAIDNSVEHVCRHCGACVSPKGETMLKSPIEISQLPQPMIDEINSMPMDEIAHLLLYRRDYNVWKSLLKKYSVRLCLCGARIG